MNSLTPLVQKLHQVIAIAPISTENETKTPFTTSI